MASHRFVKVETLSDAWFPLQRVQICIEVDAAYDPSDVPETAKRRIAADLVRRVVEGMEPGDLRPSGGAAARPVTAYRDSSHLVQGGLGPAAEPWVQPADIDMRVAKTAHRLILEIVQRSQSEQQVLASGLIRDGVVSGPTMSRAMDSKEPLGQYMAPFIRVSPSGRTRALELTDKGRTMAAKIRSGSAPL